MSLPELQISYNTSDNDIDSEFYLPCLSWANRLERGVGYFTTGWISKNARGLAQFVANGGTAKWITSPILDEKDYEVLSSLKEMDKSVYLEKIFEQNVEKLQTEMEQNTKNAFAWMVHDGVLEIRFAIPVCKLEGDFHTKFGIFYGPDDQVVAFEGSNNDSKKGFSNYESFMVFMSWMGMKNYIDVECNKFKGLWDGRDRNVEIFKMSEAIRKKVFKLRTGERPFRIKTKTFCVDEDKWRHQEEAKRIFLKEKRGILAMATGTGKTFTSIKIMKHLLDGNQIDRIIIIIDGNDLLRQWYLEIMEQFDNLRIFQNYSKHRQVPEFLMCKKKCILLISRQTEWLLNCFNKLKKNDPISLNRTLLVFDEVHGLGSDKLCCHLEGKIKAFQYRLGLSATPQRPFDEKGNFFIEQEVGPVIYKFGLSQAIQRGILCELNYIPLPYELTDEEKKEKRNIIAYYEMKKSKGESFDETELYRRLSLVNKLAKNKLVQFETLINKHPEFLERSIIFVETMEYGEEVQKVLSQFTYNYHTYFADDNISQLSKFSKGQIDCLVTCKKVSEGMDIKTVKNVILFSSERGRLVTTQRIGRSLRWNPEEPDKRANVVDFICVKFEASEDFEAAADKERKEWLESLSCVRRERD